jgi:hypothetical protein
MQKANKNTLEKRFYVSLSGHRHIFTLHFCGRSIRLANYNNHCSRRKIDFGHAEKPSYEDATIIQKMTTCKIREDMRSSVDRGTSTADCQQSRSVASATRETAEEIDREGFFFNKLSSTVEIRGVTRELPMSTSPAVLTNLRQSNPTANSHLPTKRPAANSS